MPFLFNKSGIVNVRMVITEEKILSNIEKVQKMINPKSKKQIIQLEDDAYFKDLIDSIKTYLVEYPKKKNFPVSVYRAAYDLVEFATNQFEENTKKIEELIVQREKNIGLAYELKETLAILKDKKEGWKVELLAAEDKYPEDIVEAINLIAAGSEEEATAATKLIEARINNLESNFHIEIDMERIEDKSKALSYIGIEIAESLKYIPAPVGDFSEEKVAEKAETLEKAETVIEQEKADAVVKAAQPVEEAEEDTVLDDSYIEQTRFEVKPSLWQRIKNSKLVRTISYIMKIRVVLELPALPEGRGENQQ